MTNEELIKALQCASHFALYQDCYEKNCYANSGKGLYCNIPKLMADAADALEAADKRIAELEAQLPKEGEWLRTDAFPHRIYCSVCYKTYVPNDRWQIWVDGDIPKKFCPNCGSVMKGGCK